MHNLQSSSIFKKLKDVFWPITRVEMKLFVPLALMMLCVLFNFGTLRSIKDSLVVPNIGAESISFLKLWLVLPSTIIFTLIYIKLCNIFDYRNLFYLIISFFLGFFAIFTYVIFPNQEFYHPSKEIVESLINAYPHFRWFILIGGKWSYALMYIFCELWSAVIINLLFWQFANRIFDINSAKRLYPFLGMVGNLGLIIAGNVLIIFSEIYNVSNGGENIKSEVVLKSIMIIVIFAGIVTMILYKYINQYVLQTKDLENISARADKKTKTKLSVVDSIKLLLNSRYIGHIVLLVLCYGLLINILEGPWKARVNELYPNTVDYLQFMGKFNIWMGVSCVAFMFIGSNILRSFSWLVAALVTPYMLMCTGIIFFSFIIFADNFDFYSFNPIYLAVIIGAVQNILSKSTKYSLFDSTKEMAYIPLSLELRTKGKAAVEVIGLKFGKSLGALIQSFIFIFMPFATFDSITGYLLGIFIVVIMIWIWNIHSLNKKYVKLKGDK